MVFFCPRCWKEIKGEDKKCPHCGADITEHEKKGFEGELINALSHPERETVERAVWILGRLKSVKAVTPLTSIFENTDNPFLKIAILNALSKIATEDSVDFIVKALNSEVGIVRGRAKEIIKLMDIK